MWLDHAYAANLGKVDPAEVDRSFRIALRDPAVKQAAHDRLAALSDKKGDHLCRRDHITGVHRAILQKVLNA